MQVLHTQRLCAAIRIPQAHGSNKNYTSCWSRSCGLPRAGSRGGGQRVLKLRRIPNKVHCQPAYADAGGEAGPSSTGIWDAQVEERGTGDASTSGGDAGNQGGGLAGREGNGPGQAAAGPEAAGAAQRPPAITWMTAFIWGVVQRLGAIWNALPAAADRRRLKHLTAAWQREPASVDKMAALMAELTRQRRYSDALKLVHESKSPINDAVVVEYLRALVESNQITDYKAGGPLREGEDHRSVLELLKELRARAEGEEGVVGSPGATSTRPLHIAMQEVRRGGGGLMQTLERLVATIVSAWLAMLALSVLFLVGSAAMQRSSNSSSSSLTSSIPGMSAPAAVSSSTSASSYAPKEYIKDAVPEKSQKTFKDVKGCDEAKAELEEIVEFLKNPDKFTRLGGKLPKGVLLTGPPGTGKTLLAKAIAGEAGVPFFFRAGSEFEEMFVGVGSRRVRALFAAAKKKAPCIVFIDEIDAVGASRKMWENNTRKTLNQLLVEMDGFESNEGVIVVAATNLQDSLDPALTRPGRFDRHVSVPLPDVRGRLAILSYYLEGKPVAADVDAAGLARRTPGFSGAELSNMINEAALIAAKTNADSINANMLDEARDKILMGTERRSLVQSAESRRLTAYHESGHALVALNTVGAKPIHKATIVPRGNALGMVSQVPDKDEYNVTKQQIMADIDVSMGGKVAEEIIFGPDQVTTGARSDLQHATRRARHLVMECGMSEAVGPVFVESGEGRSMGSSETAKRVDEEIGRILRESYAKVTSLLKDKEEQLHTLAQALLEHETLTQTEIGQVLEGTFTRAPVGKAAPMDYETFIATDGGHVPVLPEE